MVRWRKEQVTKAELFFNSKIRISKAKKINFKWVDHDVECGEKDTNTTFKKGKEGIDTKDGWMYGGRPEYI